MDAASIEDSALAALRGADDPSHGPHALARVIEAAASLARAGIAPPHVRTPVDPAPDTLVSFVICSVEPTRLALARESIGDAFDGTPWELVHVADARSLAEGYERGRAKARGDVIVFCHDDIVLVADHFRARLLDALQRADVVGVAGATKVTGPAWFWSGPPHIHSWVAHLSGARLMAGIASAAPAFVADAQALDGVFIATHRETAERVRFDPVAFDAWHGYDVDFSYRAHLAGLRVAIAQDLLLVHRSTGSFGRDYLKYAARLCEKFPHFERRRENAAALFHGAPVDSLDAVRTTCAWLDDWTRRLA